VRLLRIVPVVLPVVPVPSVLLTLGTGRFVVVVRPSDVVVLARATGRLVRSERMRDLDCSMDADVVRVGDRV